MNGITIPNPVKTPSAFPVSINKTVLLISSMPLLSFWTRAIHGTWFQQFLCYSTTLTIETLCPISILNKQLTNLEQTHIRCSIHCERWTVKGKDCTSVLHSFKKMSHRTDEWTKQLLRLKSWVISGSPEQGIEFCHLWRLVNVFRCSCLFHLFDFYCLLVQKLLFFWKSTFFVLFFDDFEWEVEVHQQILRMVTLPEAAAAATSLCTLQKFTLA